MSRRKKRFWANEEKREICLQATTPRMSVAQVARRYAANANLIFKWLKDPRFSLETDAPDQEATFLPVEIEADIVHETTAVDLSPPPGPSLSYLQHFQFDKLKVDRSFVVASADDRQSQAVVSLVVTLADKLGMETTAEGVEEKDRLHLRTGLSPG